MIALQNKTFADSSGFHLDEVDFFVSLICLEHHAEAMASDAAPTAVQEFYRKVFRDGRVKDFRAAEDLAYHEDRALIGSCLEHVINYECPAKLKDVMFRYRRSNFDRPCIVLEGAPAGTDLAYAAVAYMKRFADELNVDCETIRYCIE